MRPDLKMKPGETLLARTWNSLVDRVRALEARTPQTGAPAAPLPVGVMPAQEMVAVNVGDSDLPAFSPAGISSSFYESPEDLRTHATLAVEIPTSEHAGKWCVTAEPIKVGEAGRVWISGVCPVRISNSGDTPERVDIAAGETFVEPSLTGAGQVLFEDESGADPHLVLIRLGIVILSSVISIAACNQLDSRAPTTVYKFDFVGYETTGAASGQPPETIVSKALLTLETPIKANRKYKLIFRCAGQDKFTGANQSEYVRANIFRDGPLESAEILAVIKLQEVTVEIDPDAVTFSNEGALAKGNTYGIGFVRAGLNVDVTDDDIDIIIQAGRESTSTLYGDGWRSSQEMTAAADIHGFILYADNQVLTLLGGGVVTGMYSEFGVGKEAFVVITG